MQASKADKNSSKFANSQFPSNWWLFPYVKPSNFVVFSLYLQLMHIFLSEQKMPEGSWKCEKCNNINYPFRTKCNRQNCGADKPADSKKSPSPTADENDQVRCVKHFFCISTSILKSLWRSVTYMDSNIFYILFEPFMLTDQLRLKFPALFRSLFFFSVMVFDLAYYFLFLSLNCIL